MKIPYNQMDADLVRLAMTRTGESLRGVMQLAGSPGQAFQIALGGVSTSLATSMGAWAAHRGVALETIDKKAFAAAMLNLLLEGVD